MNEKFEWSLHVEDWKAATVSSEEMMKAFDLAATQAYQRSHWTHWSRSLLHLPPTKAEMAEVLERAADLLESGVLEWLQGKERSVNFHTRETTAVCAIGAVRETCGMYTDINVANKNRHLSAAVLNLLTDHLRVEVHVWNDEKGRTRIEVIEMFKTVAKDLRNG